MDKKYLPQKIIIGMIYAIIAYVAIFSYGQNPQWIYDAIAMFFFTTLLLLIYKKLHINTATMLACAITITLHSFGVFGFYSTAPLGLRYDHYVHFFGGFAVCMIAYNYLERYHSNTTYKNIHRPAVIILSICIAMGLGSIIEMTEFVGWYVYGEGEGLFLFGAGDYTGPVGVAGEWVNASWDMIYNSLGALLGAMLMSAQIKWMHKEPDKKIIKMCQ